MNDNRPQGDVWILKDTDRNSQFYGKSYTCDFSYISNEEMKDVLKKYIWMNYRTGNKVTNKLYYEVQRLKYFNEFANNRSIKCFLDLTTVDISNYVSFLRTRQSDVTNKLLAYSTQKNYLDTLKAVIHWCQIHKPEAVPSKEIFTGNEYRGINKNLKIEFIPDDVLIKVNEALKIEKNPYIKYGIIILETTGMRIGDLLELTIECIKPHVINGYTITWFDHKNRKERPPMPIPLECAKAVSKLIESTEKLRELADCSIKKYLFIHKVLNGKCVGKIMKIGQNRIHDWFDNFIKKNKILDTNGEPYRLTAHKFRRTLATDMFSKGTNINVIKEVLGHVEAAITKRHYADMKDKERADIFKKIGIIGNINQIDAEVIVNPIELEWFNANRDKGACMSDGYCTKPFVDGQICQRLLKRQKCYTCSRYITTPEYLETHRNHLKGLEKQVAENIYGNHYADHFKSTIEILKVIISKLEELQDADK